MTSKQRREIEAKLTALYREKIEKIRACERETRKGRELMAGCMKEAADKREHIMTGIVITLHCMGCSVEWDDDNKAKIIEY